MGVKLDANNRPVAWGEKLKGKDIPDPPDENPPRAYQWDESTEEWVFDETYTAPNPPSVNRDLVSSHTRQAFRDARANDDLQTQLDILFEVLTGETP